MLTFHVSLLPIIVSAQDVPFTPKTFNQDQDAGAVSANFRSLSSRGKDNTTPTVPGACGTNLVLINDNCVSLDPTTVSSTWTGNNTWTGTQNFTSSVTVPGGLSNFCVLVASQDVTSGPVPSTVTFSNTWVSSATYVIEYQIVTSSAMNLAMLINGDYAGNYKNSGLAWSSTGTGVYGETTGYYITLNQDNSSTSLASGGVLYGKISCSSEFGNSKNVRCFGSGNDDVVLNSEISDGFSVASRYAGSSNFSSVSIVRTSGVSTAQANSTGNYRGHFDVYQCPGHP